MKKIFTLILSAVAFTASSQNPTTGCTVLNQGVCDQVLEDFDTDPSALFDTYGFTWSGVGTENLRATGVQPSSSYNITTPFPGYYLYTNGTIRTGFTLGTGPAGSSNDYFSGGNTVHLTLQVFSPDMLTLLAQCDYNLSAPGAYCFGIADADLVAGTKVRYRYTFTTTQQTSTTGGGPTLTLDDITIFGLQQAPLPVKFSSFTGRRLNGGVNLTWNVDAELNVNTYSVERSADGNRFTEIGSVIAGGMGTYSFQDQAPLATGYYRIKSVDVDGKYGYSTVIRIGGGQSNVVIKAFFNNPTSLTIQHDLSNDGGRIFVSTADGRIVKDVTIASGTQQTQIDVSSVQSGMLIVRYVAANGNSESIKVMKL
jgi:hypothetical protein